MKYQKVLLVFLVGILFFVVNTPSSFASENFEKVKPVLGSEIEKLQVGPVINVEESEITLIDEDELQTQNTGIGVAVPKPIRTQGVMSNSQLKAYIEFRKKEESRLTTVAYLSGALTASQGVGLVIGGVAALAGHFYDSKSLDTMKIAASRGESYYWVQVYASGVVPSLSVQFMDTYSSQKMYFFYDN